MNMMFAKDIWADLFMAGVFAFMMTLGMMYLGQKLRKYQKREEFNYLLHEDKWWLILFRREPVGFFASHTYFVIAPQDHRIFTPEIRKGALTKLLYFSTDSLPKLYSEQEFRELYVQYKGFENMQPKETKGV